MKYPALRDDPELERIFDVAYSKWEDMVEAQVSVPPELEELIQYLADDYV